MKTVQKIALQKLTILNLWTDSTCQPQSTFYISLQRVWTPIPVVMVRIFFFFSGVADSVFHLHSRSLLNFAYISPSENKTNVCTGYICSQYLLYVLMPKFSLFRPQKFPLVQLTQRCKFKHFLHSCWKILETLHCMYNNKKSLNAALNGATMVQLIGIYM